MASMLAARCRSLCSLDLWRCRNLTDRGLAELVTGCRLMFSLITGLFDFYAVNQAVHLRVTHNVIMLRSVSLHLCTGSDQNVGGVGPRLVPNVTEQHWMFPAPGSQPAIPAQTFPHR